MLRTLALSVSALALASGVAFAEGTTTKDPMSGRSVVTNPSSSLSTSRWLVSDVYKAAVYIPPKTRLVTSPILSLIATATS